MPLLTFAFCTYNRADRLDRLIAAMRAQTCPIPFEILAINNNSQDRTEAELARLQKLPGAPLRWVSEPVQGIVAARNRGVAEALASDVFVFIDDDEIPRPGLIAAAADAILNEGAECAGGRVEMDFSTQPRPCWLTDDLLGFLAAVDHGPEPFWIRDASTPVWTANVAYATRIFRDDSALRYDKRFDRIGNVVGGGSDAIMFRTLLERGMRLRWRPDMAVLHDVEPWRLHRRYFLELHYRAGVRKGRYELPDHPQRIAGIPRFLFGQLVTQSLRAVGMYCTRRPGKLRQLMNAAHLLGMMKGYFLRARPA